ncbi:hypothetical protein C8J56DRAFT_1103561 [Mycena floridula]|nr:hypothetical protein C8J56DRAFT_1103561 [Mycena floridula]
MSDVETLWGLIGPVMWSDLEFVQSLLDPHALEAVFRKYGTQYGFASSHSIFPPNTHCTVCQSKSGHKLQTAASKQVVLYTMEHGPLPVIEVHFTCRTPGCNSVFYPNFRVKDGVRIYYDKISPLIQIGDHQYAELKLIKSWMLNMNIAWMSASNCAGIYTALHNDILPFPAEWSVGPALTHKHVYSAFTTLALWQDHLDRESDLEVPHTGTQSSRFTQAVQDRNMRIRLYGLPDVRHCCEKCVHRIPATEDEPGRELQVLVGDGVTVGRPRCGITECKEPLAKSRQSYCPEHAHMSSICAIKGCDELIQSDRRTCSNAEHQKVEDSYIERGKGMFQLKERLHHARVPVVLDGASADDEVDLADLVEAVADDEPFAPEPDPDIPSSAPSDVTKPRLCSLITRTHNEQLIVAACGIIVARETFYNAEGISSVAEMLRRVAYQRDRMPEYFVYDNNCSLSKHVKHDEDFRHVGLPVDVFHFKSKHAITDVWCQQNCNPAAFPDLISDDGKGWWFNTSIAEQTNAWFGAFLSICREMTAARYDFFLDEMIIMRNRRTMATLKKRGFCPGYF